MIFFASVSISVKACSATERLFAFGVMVTATPWLLQYGKHILHMCRDGLDMHVIVYDPYISEVPEGVEKVDDLSELLRRADVVTLHCLLTDETRKLIDRERLALMKPTALLINCARGPIVDEAALIEALENGRLAGAGLDVTDPEPVAPDSPLFKLPNVIVTPHYAPTTVESATRVSKIAAENINAVLAGKEPVAASSEQD